MTDARHRIVLDTGRRGAAAVARLRGLGFDVGVGESAEARVRVAVEDPAIAANVVGLVARLLEAPVPRDGPLPRPADPAFTGRELEIQRLHALLATSAPVALIPSAAGVGCTSVALHYAHRFMASYSDVLWVPAGDPIERLADLAPRLGVRSLGTPTERARRVRAALEDGRSALLLLDDYAGPPELLPQRGACRVLMTLRAGAPTGDAVPVEIGPLPVPIARLLLSREIGAAPPPLLASLGGNPFALRLVGRLLWLTGRPVGALQAALGSSPDLERLVAIALEWCAALRPGALRLLPMLDPPIATGHVLAAAGPDGAMDLAALACAGVVAVERGSQLRLPSAVRRSLSEEGLPSALLDVLAEAARQWDPLPWASGRARSDLPDHLRAAVPRLHAASPREHFWLGLRLVQAQRSAGDTHAAVATAEQLSAIAPPIWAPFLHEEIAQALYHRGDFEGSLARYREVLQHKRSLAGPDHPDVASTLGDMGLVAARAGDPAAALEFQQQALDIQRAALDPDHPEVAETLHGMGQSLHALGRWEDACERFAAALDIREMTLGPTHPATGVTRYALGESTRKLGEMEEALEWFGRALVSSEEALGRDHADLAVILQAMGEVQADLGRYAQALACLSRALKLNSRALSPRDLRLATTLFGVGRCEAELGQTTAALAHLHRALLIQEQGGIPEQDGTGLGVDERGRPEIADTLYAIGELLLAGGDYPQSLEYFARCLAVTERILGAGHPQVAVAQHAIGQALAGAGQLEQARAHVLQALALFDVALGQEHPQRALALATLAQLDWATGDLDAAALRYGQALAALEATLGPDDPTTLAVRDDAEQLAALCRG